MLTSSCWMERPPVFVPLDCVSLVSYLFPPPKKPDVIVNGVCEQVLNTDVVNLTPLGYLCELHLSVRQISYKWDQLFIVSLGLFGSEIVVCVCSKMFHMLHSFHHRSYFTVSSHIKDSAKFKFSKKMTGKKK